MILIILLLIKCHCSIDMAQSMFNIINSYRLGNDLKQLKIITNLDSVAKEQALHMCENRNLTHDNPIGGIETRAKRYGYTGTKIKENIAKTKNKDIEEVAKTWMTSEKHRKNILGNFAYSGVGTCLDKDGNRYWVQVFGTEKKSKQENEVYSDAESDTHSSTKSKDSDTNENPNMETESASSKEKRKMPPITIKGDMFRSAHSTEIKTVDILSKLLQEKSPECLPVFQSLAHPNKKTKSSFSPFQESVSTEIRTSYIPISSTIYKTYTKTIFNDITRVLSSKEEKKHPQTVFMVLPFPQSMVSVPVASKPEKSTSEPPKRTDSVVSRSQYSTVSISTVYVTVKDEPKTMPVSSVKTISVTETVRPSTTYVSQSKTVTVTVSKEQSVRSLEKTVTVTVSSEQTVSVTSSFKNTVTITSSSQVPITTTINIEKVVTVRLKPMARKKSPSTESYSHPNSAYRDSNQRMDLAPQEDEDYQDSEPSSGENVPEENSSQPEILLRPKSPRKRSTLKRPRIKLIAIPEKNTRRTPKKTGFSQSKKPKIEMYETVPYTKQYSAPKKSKNKNARADRQYFIENAMSSSPDYTENENNSFLNNPCGTRDNPCIRQVFVRE